MNAALTLCLLIFLFLPSVPASAGEFQKNLIGHWKCISGDCPDEEIDFEFEAGKRVYKSWLHERPSVIDGTWELSNKVLTVVSNGEEEKWTALKIDTRDMILKNQEGKENTVFHRLK